MKSSSLEKKIFLLNGLVFFSLLAMSFAALWSIDSLNKSIEHGNFLSTAIRDQGQADMMHDALRADVVDGPENCP